MTAVLRCAHPQAVPVESGGETVAALCPDCDQRLSVAWLTCGHENSIELPTFDTRPPHQRICTDCHETYWPSA